MDEVTTADVVVVGGGLAGLAAAATAAGDGRRVVLLDAHPFGGRARTEERNGYVFNRGPRALYLGGKGRAILQQFGIDPAGGPPLLKGSMGLLGGALHLLPQGPGSLVRTDLLGIKAKLKMGALLGRMQKIDATALTGMTLDEWLADTGLPPAAADLVRMLVRVATYTNAPDQMSADIAVEQAQLALGPGRPLHRRRLADPGRRAGAGRPRGRRRAADRRQRPGHRRRCLGQRRHERHRRR